MVEGIGYRGQTSDFGSWIFKARQVLLLAYHDAGLCFSTWPGLDSSAAASGPLPIITTPLWLQGEDARYQIKSRGDRPFVFTSLETDTGLDSVIDSGVGRGKL